MSLTIFTRYWLCFIIMIFILGLQYLQDSKTKVSGTRKSTGEQNIFVFLTFLFFITDKARATGEGRQKVSVL